jgi:hypothetical protein
VSIPEEDGGVAAVKPCPQCQQPAREADPRTEYVKDRPWVCDPCALWFTGTASEFQKYRIAEAVAAAEAMTTTPLPRPKDTDQ